MSDEPVGALVRLRVDELQLHSACDLVPEMTSQEWTEFLADIGSRGIQEPLVIDGANILDGRHRFRAAQAAGIDTLVCRRVVLGEDEQVQYVIAAALHRRQLSDDQRAIMAARYRERLVAESKAERAAQGGKAGGRNHPKDFSLGEDATPKLKTEKPPKERATIRAARQFNVSEHLTRRGTTVIRNCDSRIVAAVNAGLISLSCAKTLAHLSPHKQAIIASGGWGAMKVAARQAIDMGAAHEIPDDETPEDDDSDGDSEQPAPRLSMSQEFRRPQASGHNEKSERAARVERMSFLQKLKSFHNELISIRGDREPEDVFSGWPEDQIDEAWDYMDRIQLELALLLGAVKEGD